MSKLDFPKCSICNIKTEKTDNAGEYVCPQCARVYVPDKEIVEYDDDFGTSHSDEQPEIEGISRGPGFIMATDEQDLGLTDQLYRNAKHKPLTGEGAHNWD